VSPTRAELTERVVSIIAEALDRSPAEVTPHSSLVDDLGAESIDFLDIGFRIESAFDIQIPNDEIWQGAFGKKDPSPEDIAAAVERLKEKMPEFRWDRFPKGVGKPDLPRLITVGTILDYLEQKLAPA
jgi:acyl carrier protein